MGNLTWLPQLAALPQFTAFSLVFNDVIMRSVLETTNESASKQLTDSVSRRQAQQDTPLDATAENNNAAGAGDDGGQRRGAVRSAPALGGGGSAVESPVDNPDAYRERLARLRALAGLETPNVTPFSLIISTIT